MHPERDRIFGARLFASNHYASRGGLVLDSLRCRNSGQGPMIALVVGYAVVALCVLDRSTAWLKALRPALGFGWLALLVLPWFIAIAIASSGEFYRIAIGQSLLGKVTAGQQGHGAPPGTYFLLYWIMFWPAAGLALMAFPWVWQNRGEAAVRFCLAWILRFFRRGSCSSSSAPSCRIMFCQSIPPSLR